METASISELVRQRIQKDTTSFKEVDPTFQDRLKKVVNASIIHLAEAIPETRDTTLVEHLGSSGVLTPNERRLAARQAMQGEPIIAQRTSYEEQATNEPERVVEPTIHIIGNASIRVVRDERQTMIDVLRCLPDLLKTSAIATPEGSSNIQITQMRAKLHLRTRGALGQYSLVTHDLTDINDPEKLIALYTDALKGVFLAKGNPNRGDIATPLLMSELWRELLPTDPTNLSIPLVVSTILPEREVSNNNLDDLMEQIPSRLYILAQPKIAPHLRLKT